MLLAWCNLVVDKRSLVPQSHLRVVHLVYHLWEVIRIIRAFFGNISSSATNKLVTILAESEIFLFEGLSLMSFFGHLDFLWFVTGGDPLGGAERTSLWCSLHVFHVKSLVFAIRPGHPLPYIFFFQKWRLGLFVLVSHFRVGRAEVIHPADVDLSSGVFGQIIHDVVSDILHSSETTERYPTDRIYSDVV